MTVAITLYANITMPLKISTPEQKRTSQIG